MTKILKDLLERFFIEKKILSVEEIIEAKKELSDWPELLVKKGILKDEELQKAIAYFSDLPYVELKNIFVPKDVLRIIPEVIARKNKIVAFKKGKNGIKVALIDPEDISTIDFIRKKAEAKIILHITSEDSIKKVLAQYQKSLKAEFSDIIEKNSQTALAKRGNQEELEKMASDLPIVKVVDTLIKHAILQVASDIHIEPMEEEMVVRYRIDGILHDIMNLPLELLNFVVARIKVLSNLKLDEKRLPQDGRFSLKKDDLNVSFRVSIIPVFRGEKIVIRILNEASKGLTLEKIGVEGGDLEKVQRAIRRPFGMILVVGPTGSGKTTTLYTALDILNSREVNISTIEDPIEYQVAGINQTQVQPKIGLTFSLGLRALLRQDPDIIMVGEIRDKETVEVAVHAAMTGHLVLSSLHTNSATGTLPRLMDMGVEPFLLASTLNVVIAQRLVRRICPHCITDARLDKEQLNVLEKSGKKADLMRAMKEDFRIDRKELNKDLKEITFKVGRGCDFCSGGYKGRIGIFEVLEIDEDLAKMIIQSNDSVSLQKEAKKKGMRTMFEDGFLKAVLGITTIDEVLKNVEV